MDGALEDHLRCRRNGSGNWRCKAAVVPGRIYCEKHCIYNSTRTKRGKMNRLGFAADDGQAKTGTGVSTRYRAITSENPENGNVGFAAPAGNVGFTLGGETGSLAWTRIREQPDKEDVELLAANGNGGTSAAVSEGIARLFGEVSSSTVNFDQNKLPFGGHGQQVQGGVFGDVAFTKGCQFGDRQFGNLGTSFGWGCDTFGNLPSWSSGGSGYEKTIGASAVQTGRTYIGDRGNVGASASSVGVEFPFLQGGHVSGRSGGFLNLCENGGLGGVPSLLGVPNLNSDIWFGNGSFTNGTEAHTKAGQFLVSGEIQEKCGGYDHQKVGVIQVHGKHGQAEGWNSEKKTDGLVQGVVAIGNEVEREEVKTVVKLGCPKGSWNKDKRISAKEKKDKVTHSQFVTDGVVQGVIPIGNEVGREEVKSVVKLGRPKGSRNKYKRISAEDKNDRVTQSQFVVGIECEYGDYENQKVVVNQISGSKRKRGQPKGSKDKKKPEGVGDGGITSGNEVGGAEDKPEVEHCCPRRVNDTDEKTSVNGKSEGKQSQFVGEIEGKYKDQKVGFNLIPLEGKKRGRPFGSKSLNIKPGVKLGRPVGSKTKHRGISKESKSQVRQNQFVVATKSGDGVTSSQTRSANAEDRTLNVMFGRGDSSNNSNAVLMVRRNQGTCNEVMAVDGDGAFQTIGVKTWTANINDGVMPTKGKICVGDQEDNLDLNFEISHPIGLEVGLGNVGLLGAEKKRGRPKGSKNKYNVALANKEGFGKRLIVNERALNQTIGVKTTKDSGHTKEIYENKTELFPTRSSVCDGEKAAGQTYETTHDLFASGRSNAIVQNFSGDDVQCKRKRGRPKGSKNKKSALRCKVEELKSEEICGLGEVAIVKVLPRQRYGCGRTKFFGGRLCKRQPKLMKQKVRNIWSKICGIMRQSY